VRPAGIRNVSSTHAVERGVALTLIVESEGESEEQLTGDAIRAFKGVPAARMHLYYWPLAQRERNQAGRPGRLHAKCAIVDNVAVVGSANLTDDAFNRNMELGLLVSDPIVVSGIAGHFEELIRRGVLTKVGSESK
jgi:phosphatidylserine/phosphatidylglycerophosphate/cardiolipin synthase-like enzyme